MRHLDIHISKAVLTGFNVRFDDDGSPRVEATIALLTEQDKHVTDYTIGTHSWDEEMKFDLPFKMIVPIQKIAAALEQVIVEHLHKGQLALTSGV